MKFRLFIDHDAGPDHRRTDGKVIRAAFVSCRAFRTEGERERERGRGGVKERRLLCDSFFFFFLFFLEIQLAKRRYVSPYRYFIPYRLSPEISCSLKAQVTLFFRSHGGHPSLSPFVSRQQCAQPRMPR